MVESSKVGVCLRSTFTVSGMSGLELLDTLLFDSDLSSVHGDKVLQCSMGLFLGFFGIVAST